MATLRTETFIHELPLRVTPAQERELAVCFDCARQLYNACLDAALKRLQSMRESRAFRRARIMKRGRERVVAFRRLDEKFGFREYDLHAVATRVKNACHIGDHLDAHVAQKTASRAFAAAREYAFDLRGSRRVCDSAEPSKLGVAPREPICVRPSAFRFFEKTVRTSQKHLSHGSSTASCP